MGELATNGREKRVVRPKREDAEFRRGDTERNRQTKDKIGSIRRSFPSAPSLVKIKRANKIEHTKHQTSNRQKKNQHGVASS